MEVVLDIFKLYKLKILWAEIQPGVGIQAALAPIVKITKNIVQQRVPVVEIHFI